jgi:phosphoglycerate dehydrogenase-like enzyme
VSNAPSARYAAGVIRNTVPSLAPLVVVADTMDPTGESHDYLAASGVRVVVGRPLWEPDELEEEAFIEMVHAADAIVGGGRERITRRVLEACPRLRCVAKYGIGIDRIDDVAATELGIVVANTPIPLAIRSVAEHTLALILGLVRRLQPLGTRARNGGWRVVGLDGATDDLYGKTVGIIGLGRIGSVVSRLLEPFGVTVLATDPYRDASYAAERGAALVPLGELLERSDVITLHVPLTDETRAMIDADALSRMKTSAYLVNTCRGPVVDTGALTAALETRQIAGAGLDVADPEPLPPGAALLSMDSVLITTHVASWTAPVVRAQMLAAADAALAAVRGETPRYVINDDVLPRRRGRNEPLL